MRPTSGPQVTGLGPLGARPLTPQYREPPQSVSIFDGQPEATEVARGSRPAITANGQVVTPGGYPNRIIRGFSFLTAPPASKLVNVVTGVPSRPQPLAKKSRR